MYGENRRDPTVALVADIAVVAGISMQTKL
jgi:hypothetical protein